MELRITSCILNLIMETNVEKEIIHIKEPFFTAGRLYGWSGKAIGLGIDLRKFLGDGNMYVKVGDSEKIWVVDKEIARKFVKKYESYYEAKGGVKLGVLAWDLFESEEKIREYQEVMF